MIRKVAKGCSTLSPLILVGVGVCAGYLIRGSAVALHQTAALSARPASEAVWTCAAHREVRRDRPGVCSKCGAALVPEGAIAAPAKVAKLKYACSMFCVPPQDKPGRCPVCGMQMVPVSQEDATAVTATATLTLSPTAEKLAEIQVSPVERKFVSTEVRMVGLIDYDEYDKARNAPVRQGIHGRTQGRAVARLGVTLEAYEPDLIWIRVGQAVDFEAEACPGETFSGRIVFIDGRVDNFTRTVDVRVRVPDMDRRLKLGMLIRAVIRVTLAEEGEVLNLRPKGAWICPMHDEMTSDAPGRCDKCGMLLRHAETLGFLPSEDGSRRPPLVIPATAPLVTGKRAVVYVAVPDQPGTYVGQTVRLGPRAGQYYIVRAGLQEGELVVTNGNFKIDSALQILARPCMMNPPPEQDTGRTAVPPSDRPEEVTLTEAPPAEVPAPDDTAPMRSTPSRSARTRPSVMAMRRGGSLSARADEVPNAFRRSFDAVLSAYFRLQTALSKDDLRAAKGAFESLQAALDTVDTGLLAHSSEQAWRTLRVSLARSMERTSAAPDLDKARAAFRPLSDTIYAIASRFGTSGGRSIRRFHCPMAFNNRGADWLQTAEKAENPYFGAAMYRCGVLTETLSTGAAGTKHHDESHP
ncbi:MAG: heavy metal-binding domain-containing protein [Phycisphaerae bacterium]